MLYSRSRTCQGRHLYSIQVNFLFASKESVLVNLVLNIVSQTKNFLSGRATCNDLDNEPVKTHLHDLAPFSILCKLH